MKKTKQNRKWIKRVVSLATALCLLSLDLPMREIGDTFKLIDFSRFTISAQAATQDPTRFETEDGASNLDNMTLTIADFAEYLRCYRNVSGFAALHANDTITINPAATHGKLESSGDNQYYPLGTTAVPFNGTIRITAIDSSSLLLLTDQPLFDVVYDTVAIYKGETSDVFSLEFIKTAGNPQPLMANEVRHTGDGGAEWRILLSGESIVDSDSNGQKTTYANYNYYGGVIGKMAENATLTLDYTDNSTAEQGAWVKRNTAQGILCGEMESGSSLTASYTNANNRTITVGDASDIHTGGMVGSMAGASFTLDSASGLNFTVTSKSKNAGLLVGYATDDDNDNPSTITLADGLSFTGSVTGTGEKVGGLVGSLEGSDIQIGATETGSVTLSGVTVSGTNKVGGAIGYFSPSVNTSKSLTNITYNMTNCTISGNNAGGIYGEYTAVGGENIDVTKYVFSGTKLNKGNAGGVFGVYNGTGSATITGVYNAPESSVHFGGVIGQYKSTALTDTLKLSALTVNNVKQTSNTQKLGGVILNAPNASYIEVNGVTVNVIGGSDKSNTSNPFGGIVSTIGASVDTGSFIDLTGDFTLTTNTAYNGGAVAGSFKNGVLRLAGTTDLGNAQTANGYGQLIYENDSTLVFAKGSGSDTNWTFKRNGDTKASDLGQWGEVVRLIDGKNAEDAQIVTVDGTAHTATLAQASTTITDIASFAKLALNMQLNDGRDTGTLRFTDANTKFDYLSEAITINGTNGAIDLSGTGLLGFLRDGGNGKYLQSSSNTFQFQNAEFFSGSITGSANAEIKLAVGESYGCDADGTALTDGGEGGRIYLSNNWGHDAQGLFAFAKGASVSDLTISGKMHVSRVDGSNHLYMAPLFGAMTNGATLTNVTITTEVTADKANASKYYVGGVSGVFDGNDTDSKYTLSISGGQIKPEITMTGTASSDNNHNHENDNVYVGGVLGLLKGSDAAEYAVSMSNTDISPQIKLGDDVTNVNNSFMGGVIGYVRENSSNEREITFDTVTMTNALVEQRSQYSGGLLGAFWDRTKVTIDDLTISGSKVDNKRDADNNHLSGLAYRATGIVILLEK